MCEKEVVLLNIFILEFYREGSLVTTGFLRARGFQSPPFPCEARQSTSAL